MWYQNWSEPLFYASQLRTASEQQAIPLVNWLPGGPGGGSEYSLRAILLGRFDGYIRAAARSAARWGGQLFIDFAHEMNIKGNAWSPGMNGNTASEYVGAWRHVVSIFRAEHAWNVRWVWAPNTDCGGRCPFEQFYPGDRWVDWVGLDGYNSASSDGLPWREFEQVFGASYRALTSITSKPVMIAETSSTEKGGSKMRWILNMRGALLRSFPRVRALIWFNRADPGDWIINSSPGALAAFREVMALPPFSGGGEGG
jgi:beta-mannanase